MSDDEFSDFSDDQPTLISIPEQTSAPLVQKLEQELVSEIVFEEEQHKDDEIKHEVKEEETKREVENDDKVMLDDKKEDVDTKETKEIDVIQEEEEVDIQFPLTWIEYKKIEADILKFILLFCWVEEKFVVRASLKNIMYDKEFTFKSQEYDIKKYTEKTYEFLPKLCLLYIIFNFLEKCPYTEFFESKSILYVSRMYKKTPKELLEFFKPKKDSEITIEKCLGYYSKIYLEPIESREAQDFIELEKNKVKLESLFI
jgi:hypothetical protein